jgi:hypothetical protein
MSKAHYTPTYQSWQAMKQRCLNPKHAHYSNYGGRGITICPEWMVYANFLADMGERPEGHSLDREKSSEGYSPDNCKWATRTEQNRNNSQNRVVEYLGQRRCLSEWCELFGLQYARTYARLFIMNWKVKDAFSY